MVFCSLGRVRDKKNPDGVSAGVICFESSQMGASGYDEPAASNCAVSRVLMKFVITTHRLSDTRL